MINRRYLAILLILGVLFALVWFFFNRPNTNQVTKKSPGTEAHIVNGRRVLNLPPGQEETTLANLKLANTISEDWQENVKKGLRTQGGDSLKEINIQKVESIIWMINGSALNVESVAITLKGDKGERTKFRALIDSQTGKIIQSWDQPTYDPVHSRNNFSIKIDPRYHND